MEIHKMGELICNLKPRETVLLTFVAGISTNCLVELEDMYLKYEVVILEGTRKKIKELVDYNDFPEDEALRTFEVNTGPHFDLGVAREWCAVMLRYLEKVTKKTPK